MKSLLIGVVLIVGASCQIYTQVGPDGYKYPKPDARFNLPDPVDENEVIVEPQGCSNGGSGQYCCLNGADNPDCCDNGGRGQFCCTNGASNPDCCENGGRGPFCCSNGASNSDCCENGGRGPFCCANGASNPDCCDNGGRGPFCCTNGANNQNCELPTPAPPRIAPAPLPVKPVAVQPEKEEPVSYDLVTPPPLPSFIPLPSLPKIIPVNPKVPVNPIIASTPAPFRPRVQTPPAPIVQARNFEVTTNKNEYLPPLDVRSEDDEWVQWKNQYRKRYASQNEDDKRRLIFEDNVRRIKLHNQDYNAGLSTFELEKNKFCDLTQEEFVKIHTGIRGNKRSSSRGGFSGYNYDAPSIGFNGGGEGRSAGTFSSSASFTNSDGSFSSIVNSGKFGDFGGNFGGGNFGSGSGGSGSGGSGGSGSGVSNRGGAQSANNIFMPSPLLESQVDDEVDWRKKGAVTPVKNQGKCASCWAFAANGALEAQNFLKTNKLVPLSEQNLVDCVKDNDGCDGGYMTNAYEYVRSNPGVDTESSYRYEEKQSSCRFDPANVGGECNAFMEIQIGNEKALQQAVATVGPVAAGIDGGQHSFQFFKSGFYYEPKCDTEVNHAVTIVGYGKTPEGDEYWLCKNSWDTDWGEEGYVRMARNKNNHCGITTLASYPLV